MRRSRPLSAAVMGLLAGLAITSAQSAPPATSDKVAKRTEIQPDKNAPQMEGNALTSVVVTQCNLLVAVYVTTQEGKLLRFDKSAGVPPEKLLNRAYAAARSERVEVACQNAGIVGYETHQPL